MFIFLLFSFVLLGKSAITTISVVTENGIENAKGQLSNAYLQYLYSPFSNDEIECLLNGQLILPKTSARNKQLILQTIQGMQVTPSGHTCSANYYLEPRNSSTYYLIVDKNPCNLESTLQKANTLKMRGIRIFPIGVGKGVWENTLSQISGPCMGVCMPGWNYIKL